MDLHPTGRPGGVREAGRSAISEAPIRDVTATGRRRAATVRRLSYSGTVRFTVAIDLFVADMRAAGRLNSDRSKIASRATLDLHAEDVSNRDPATTNRDDVKGTLPRWTHP